MSGEFYDLLMGAMQDCSQENLDFIAKSNGCETATREAIAANRVAQVKKEKAEKPGKVISTSLTMRYEALRAANGMCQLCGARAYDGAILHVDHIKPISIHGRNANVTSNLQVLCRECNLGKSNLYEDDWRDAGHYQ